MKNEILEGNKLIAEFMGLRMEKIPLESENYNLIQWLNSDGAIVYAGGDSWSLTDVQGNDYTIPYHLSWDLLMPVMEKIGENYDVTIDIYPKSIDVTYICRPDVSRCDGEITSMGGMTPLENTWYAVVGFIKWYNTKSPNRKTLTQTKGE